MSTEHKYEIKGSFGNYSVLYGRGYPNSEFIRYTVLTLRGAKRVIRRHKRKIARGKIPLPGKYGIVHTEEALTSQDVETRIRELEHELGIGPS